MSDRYINPLCKRYASREMQFIFSDDNKFSTWRKLWVALAEGQQELGLPITDAQISELKSNIHNIDYVLADTFESELRHDVMAHIKAYAAQCPAAGPIIHLGATSCYVGDNTDIIVMREALAHTKKLLISAIAKLTDFADGHKSQVCLGYTHFQAAQPTTVGKRAALWIQDLLFDLQQLDFVQNGLKLLGCKGTTGTGASFLHLFDGDHDKILELERKIAAKMGFAETYPVSGQTYSRKVDYSVLSALSAIAQSAYKFSGDIRLMSHMKEVDEPFESGQVGSSAMAYKRNPMRSERIASLARYVIIDSLNPAFTAGTQWLERTLDDSANKRISVPEAFLAVDGILQLYINIAGGMTIYPKVMERHMREELPFIATENILMHCAKQGSDRQELHERIRIHSVEAAKRIKGEGAENDLLERIESDPAFGFKPGELEGLVASWSFTGSAKEQTEAFLKEARQVLEANKELLGIEAVVGV